MKKVKVTIYVEHEETIEVDDDATDDEVWEIVDKISDNHLQIDWSYEDE